VPYCITQRFCHQWRWTPPRSGIHQIRELVGSRVHVARLPHHLRAITERTRSKESRGDVSLFSQRFTNARSRRTDGLGRWRRHTQWPVPDQGGTTTFQATPDFTAGQNGRRHGNVELGRWSEHRNVSRLRRDTNRIERNLRDSTTWPGFRRSTLLRIRRDPHRSRYHWRNDGKDRRQLSPS
jgi:hypothetical protein